MNLADPNRPNNTKWLVEPIRNYTALQATGKVDQDLWEI